MAGKLQKVYHFEARSGVNPGPCLSFVCFGFWLLSLAGPSGINLLHEHTARQLRMSDLPLWLGSWPSGATGPGRLNLRVAQDLGAIDFPNPYEII